MRLDTVTTVFSHGRRVEQRQHFAFAASQGTENQVINLYLDRQYQALEGFGGAFTDSAGYVFSLMPPDLQQRLLETYYGADGIGYTLGRTHMDSCDFSLAHYEAMSDAADTDMASFSLKRGSQYILPLLHRAQEVHCSRIPMMVAPWSPPAFMKTTGERNGGGELKPEYHGFWANYLCRYMEELRKVGCDVRRMTVQNEPKAVQTWDSCIYTTAQEKEFIRDYLYPALREHGLDDVEIYLWDHNKERVYERVRDIMDTHMRDMVAGVAFHWYSGDHFEALDMVREAYPDLKMAQTEACIEYTHFGTGNTLANAQKYAHDLIGDLNAGMSAFYDWNLVLDENGGPNHVGNFCDAPLLYHTDTGVLEERNSLSYIAHFSRYIKPGARRIGFSRYTDAVEVTAFQNPDGSIATVLLNRTDDLLPAVIRLHGQETLLHVLPQSITTAVARG